MDYRRGTREFSGVMQLSYIFFFLYSDGSGSYTTMCVCQHSQNHILKRLPFTVCIQFLKLGGGGMARIKLPFAGGNT